MHMRKWSILALIGFMVVLFVSCEEARISPRSRDLIVVNGTTEAQISRIDITVSSFGQRMVDPSGYFQFDEETYLGSEEQFGIVLSPYIYRVVISVSYFFTEGDTIYDRSKTVTIDLPSQAALPTYVTLVYDTEGDYPDYALEITGEYVNYAQMTYK